MTAHTAAVFQGPVELVKAIFDAAAKEERSTALKLVRVCKAARTWILPIIYRTVELDNPAALRFESMLAMSSSTSPASLVRSLRITCLPNVALLSSRCHALQALSMSNYDVLHLSGLRLPSLTHLTVGGSLRYCHFSSDMTALATVTHLRFPDDVPRLADNVLSVMPQLTHFSCCYHLSKKSQHRELEQCLNIVTAAPKLRAAVVYVHTRGRRVEESVWDIPGVRDSRIAVASSVELPDETRDLSPTYGSCWAFAEEKLRKTMKRDVHDYRTRHETLN